MPLYEYRCERCSHEFTLLQAVSIRSEETVCPACGVKGSRRLFSGFATKSGEVPSSGAPRGACSSGPCGCH